MLTRNVFLVAVLSSLAGSNALSSGCETQIGALALTGGLASCLQLTSLLPVISTSGSIVDSVNQYLTSLCASTTPTCDNATLSSAQSSISTSCASDLSGGGSNAAEVEALQELLMNYQHVYAAGCSKNTTTGDYCVSSTLSSIQNSTGTNITTSFLIDLLSGQNLDSVESSFTSGSLCTGCVQQIYAQAVQANATIAQSSIASGLSSQCGSSFTSTASASGVSLGATSAAATSASSSTSAASSGGASPGFQLSSALPAVGSVAVMLSGMIVGGGLLL